MQGVKTMAGFGDIVSIGFRVISHASEIMQMWDKIMPLIKQASSTYSEVKQIVDKIAPGVLEGVVAQNVDPLATGAVAPGAPQDFSAKWLQESLNKLMNAGLEVDGDIGEETSKAVAAFQKSRGMEVDGWAGAGTSARILADLEKLKIS
jgi:hypothetical protein